MARGETYEEFVAKFRPKKTTDDCYTPPAVYDAVKAWAVKEYRLEGREVVRPFFPGGDFEHYDYPPNCVVIDNPPFSILAHILDVYRARGIDYFLFAPSLTGMNCVPRGNVIITDTDIVYDNGAKVVTAFVSNMGDWALRTAPDLRVAILAANRRSSSGDKLTIYEYPPQIVTAARLQKLAAVDFRVRRSECEFVRALDAQRRQKKALYGGGLLLSEAKAAELKAAEAKAAEAKAARTTTWELSARERAIIATLGEIIEPDGHVFQEGKG